VTLETEKQLNVTLGTENMTKKIIIIIIKKTNGKIKFILWHISFISQLRKH
jgi:hypothetical protein